MFKTLLCTIVVCATCIGNVNSKQLKTQRWYAWDPAPCFIYYGDGMFTVYGVCFKPNPNGVCIVETFCDQTS